MDSSPTKNSSTPENSGAKRPVSLSATDVQRIAHLARLALTESQISQYQGQLSAVLGLMDQLRAIDVSNVEPMSHPGGGVNRLDDDRPRTPTDTIPTEAFLRIAPATMDQFVQVPKVIGEGGGA
jgi:aspartyl-tRNA(Asn)/glutamyl-tRNA(Gln) amidotransferase subunit C